MSWLLTDTGFLLGFIVFLFAWISVFYFFHRDSKSNKTPYEERIFRAKENSLSDLKGPLGELADSPEQRPASPIEDHRVKQEAFQKRYGQSMSQALAFFLQAVSDTLVLKGLIYSFLLSLVFWLFSIRTNWSVLDWEVFGLLVRPKVFDLVCIAVFLANLLQIWTRGYWATKLALAGKDWSHIREPDWRVDPWSALRELGRQLRFRGILIALVAVLWIQF